MDRHHIRFRQEILENAPEQGVLAYMRERGDPALLAVLFEDSVAVLGVVAAALGIGLAWLTGNPIWEGIASVIIGLLLAVVALAVPLTIVTSSMAGFAMALVERRSRVALVVLSIVLRNFWCRYLCPLGAALAIPARMRMFDWLKRYPSCGNPCQLRAGAELVGEQGEP